MGRQLSPASRANIRRYKKNSERLKTSLGVRRRNRPLSVVEIDRPSECADFIDGLPPGVEVLECTPTLAQVRRRQCWSILLIDTTGQASDHRYQQLAYRAGLVIYAYYSKPLQNAISVALAVGKREGVLNVEVE